MLENALGKLFMNNWNKSSAYVTGYTCMEVHLQLSFENIDLLFSLKCYSMGRKKHKNETREYIPPKPLKVHISQCWNTVMNKAKKIY